VVYESSRDSTVAAVAEELFELRDVLVAPVSTEADAVG